MAVTTGEGTRPDGVCDHEMIFGLSSRDLPGGGGSAGKAEVIDGVNVFLDLGAVVLSIVCAKGEREREMTEISSLRLPLGEARSVIPRRARGWRTCIHLE